MTRTDAKAGSSKRWAWAPGILLLVVGLGALWSCAGPEVIKTTIRITKGRPGMMSQWEVGLETEKETLANQYGQGAIIPLAIWKRMNGTITSFTEFGCDGKPVPVNEVLMKTLDKSQDTQGVHLQGKVDYKPVWDFHDCDGMTTDCALPPRYFDPVAVDESTCPNNSPELVWVMELK